MFRLKRENTGFDKRDLKNLKLRAFSF